MPFIDGPFCDADIADNADACPACGGKLNAVLRSRAKNKKRTMLNVVIWILLGVGGLFLLVYVFGTRTDLTQEEKWDLGKRWREDIRRRVEDPATYYH
jgi:hypothetical protein